MLRAVKYVLGLRAYRDVVSLFCNWVRPTPDILFFAGSQVDLQWVIPIYEEAVARGLRCAFAGPALVVPRDAAYLDVTVHLLRYVRTRIIVTATSGLKPAWMPKNCIHKVAVPHSLVSLHMVYPRGTFDGYTDVFCCGSHHQAEIEAMNRLSGNTNRRPILMGYGKFERFTTIRPVEGNKPEGALHVLIGPSWGAGNILETLGEALLERLLAEGYHVTLRPHPSFFVYGDDIIERILASFHSNPAFVLESSIGESQALWTADMVISDYSGFAMEFAFVRERPVLYVDVPPKVLNPCWGDLGLIPLEISVREQVGIVVPSDIDQVVLGLERLAASDGKWTTKIHQERSRSWVNFGRFGAVAATELTRMLAAIRQ